VDGDGRIDPSRMLALKSLGFGDVFELHLAQDAMDELAEIAREEAKRKRKGAA
jgi:hypothetical protein